MRLGRSQYHQIARLRDACLAAGLSDAVTITITQCVEDDSADLTRAGWNERVRRVTERIAAGERPDVALDPQRPGLAGVFFGFLPAEESR